MRLNELIIRRRLASTIPNFRQTIKPIHTKTKSLNFRYERNSAQNAIFKRCIFDFSKLQQLNFNNKTKEYAEQRLLGYSMEQMYNIVADVDKYSEFVPWCKKSRVINKQGEASAQANLTVGFPPIVESYRSNLTLKKPELVMSVCADGKLFETLITTWKFGPGEAGNSQSCTLRFSVKFEFRSVIYANLSHIVFDEIVRTMVQAFLSRAKRVYGPASIKESQMRPKILKQES